jgi:hemoglobin
MSVASYPRFVLTALALTLALAGTGSAADEPAEPLDRRVLDERVAQVLRNVYDDGSQKLYNKGRITEAAYLFQGTLIAIEPLLDHHPKLQRIVSKGLADAKKMKNLDDRAWALRDVLVTVQRTIDPEPATDSLWSRIGGEKKVRKIVSEFVDAWIDDPKVNFSRDGKYKMNAEQVAAFKKQMVALASAVSGGPIKYAGKTMKEAHRGMAITNAEFDAALAHVKITLLRNSVTAADVQLIMAAVETTRADIVGSKAPPPPGKMALWDRLGGEKVVKKIVNEFVDAAGADPKVNFTRNGKYKMNAEQVAALKEQLVDLASAVSGGPRQYTGKTMKLAHKGMGITDAEFDALVAHLKTALLRNGVRGDDLETILTAINSTRADIVEVRQEGANAPAANDPVREAPVKEPAKPVGTLWNRLGGEQRVTRIVSDFVDAAVADPKVNLSRRSKYPLGARQVAELKSRLVELTSSVTGGPRQYSGKTMKEAHKGMAITDAEFDALVGHLKAALVKNGVKADDVAVVVAAVGSTRRDIVEGPAPSPEVKLPQTARLPEAAGPQEGGWGVLLQYSAATIKLSADGVCFLIGAFASR